MPVRSYHTINGKIRGSTQGGSVPLRTTHWHDAIGNVVATSNQYGVAKAAIRYSDYGAKTFDNTGWGAMRFGWIGGFGYRSIGPARSDVYVQTRHYSSSDARWTTSVRKSYMLRGESTYGYGRSNPVSFIDPSGNDPLDGHPWRDGIGPAGGGPASEPQCSAFPGLPTYGIRPPLPPGEDYVTNCCAAKRHWVDKQWLVDQVNPNCPMDYKKDGKFTDAYTGRQYDDGGNYNFGFVARCAGWPLNLTLRGAGQAKMKQSTYKKSFGSCYRGWPYGNAPDKQAIILRGWCDAYRNERVLAAKCNPLEHWRWKESTDIDQETRSPGDPTYTQWWTSGPGSAGPNRPFKRRGRGRRGS